MTREQLLDLLMGLGQSSPDGLAWLAGKRPCDSRPIFTLPFNALRAGLRGRSSRVQPIEPTDFFDLVLTAEGKIMTMAEVKGSSARSGLLCAIVAVKPLTALASEQLDKLCDWDSLSPAEQDGFFDGPLGQAIRLYRDGEAGKGRDAALVGGLGVASASGLEPQLDTSLPDIEATSEQLGIYPAEGERGSGYRGMVDGTGVIVGVVDFGCDFVHPNFRTADGATRLLSIWDQNPEAASGPRARDAEAPLGALPGQVFDRAAIDWALDPQRHHEPQGGPGGRGSPPPYVTGDDRPYWRLGYDPHARHYLPIEALGGAHGTHVLDIAAGNGRAVQSGPPRAPGVAPGADLIFVQLARPAGEQEGGAIDLANLLMGIFYIFRQAQTRERPAVVNISLNGNAGPHDGDSLFDRLIGWLLQKAGRCLTVAAGNFRQQACHARRMLQSGDKTGFTWLFPPGDVTQNRVQFWTDSQISSLSLEAVLRYRVAGRPELALPLRFRLQPRPCDKEAAKRNDDDCRLDQDQHALVWLPSSSEAVLGQDDEDEIRPPHRTLVGHAAVTAQDSQHRGTGWQRLSVSFLLQPERLRHVLSRHLPEGFWDPTVMPQVDLTLQSVKPQGQHETLVIDGWIERDDFRIDETGSNQAQQSRFLHPQEAHSLGALSCVAQSIVVGAYYDTSEARALWAHSSLGPTRVGGDKPDVSAPGRLIHAARSKGFRLRYPGSDKPWRTSATIAFSGTSMAAPHVAGIAALMLQVDESLTCDEIRRRLRRTAECPRTGVKTGGLWHAGFGQGRVSAARVLADLSNPLSDDET
ncbi:MAG: hypothetical protein Kilf2KO_38640 [Rhodospirillales bacterium]